MGGYITVAKFGSPMRSLVSDKAFFTVLIPVASFFFCSIPPIVVQRVPGYENLPTQLPELKLSLSSWLPSTQSAHLPQEIPLLFRQEQYPDSNQADLELHEYKYLQMAEKMQNMQDSGEIPFFGYIYIYDNKESRELPKV